MPSPLLTRPRLSFPSLPSFLSEPLILSNLNLLYWHQQSDTVQQCRYNDSVFKKNKRCNKMVDTLLHKTLHYTEAQFAAQ